MKILIACEFSGIIRDAFRARGHDAWSCDILECERDASYHIQGDVLRELHRGWDMMIAHPPCTRLANSGVRWLHVPPKGKTLDDMWDELRAGAEFYRALRDAPIPRKAIENPIMHQYARVLVDPGRRQVVQPWWFGDKAFKATGFELTGLPDLVPTHKLIPPARGTVEWKAWSAVHRESPGPDRWKNRSRSFPGMAEAMAEQWGRKGGL